MDCPICGSTLRELRYQDDIAGAPVTTETLATCPSRCYENHYAYGDFHVRIGAQEWRWDHSARKEDVVRILAEIEAATERFLAVRPV